ncbi:MAG: permease-like cell division protein FtsX [Bacteroidetes bacterium]|nr:permease-like cell division protein FtsX [Bacteroidota bacterium]
MALLPQEERYFQRRIATSYVTTLISTTLVLFLLGLIGLIFLHASKLSDYVKENIGFSIMIREGVREAGILELKKRLDQEPYVKSTEYIPKERAADQLQEELGEDFIGFLGYNPLLHSIDLRLKASYANADSISRIEQKLLARPEVKEVFYQKSLIDLINKNLNKVSLVLLGFSAIMFFIAIVLINNTIRLAIYSKRFLIRSMQLVGATEGFIRMPFLEKAIANGVLSSLLAIGMLVLTLYFSIEQLPELLALQDPIRLAILVVLIIAMGIGISWSSTYMSVRKYLRIKTDLLYT